MQSHAAIDSVQNIASTRAMTFTVTDGKSKLAEICRSQQTAGRSTGCQVPLGPIHGDQYHGNSHCVISLGMNQPGTDTSRPECAPDVDGESRLELEVAKTPAPDLDIRR